MNKQHEQNATSGKEKTADQTQKSESNSSAPPFTKSVRMQYPKSPTQEAPHQGASKGTINKLSTLIPKQDPVNTPQHAARGNGEAMSQEHKKS